MQTEVKYSYINVFKWTICSRWFISESAADIERSRWTDWKKSFFVYEAADRSVGVEYVSIGKSEVKSDASTRIWTLNWSISQFSCRCGGGGGGGGKKNYPVPFLIH